MTMTATIRFFMGVHVKSSVPRRRCRRFPEESRGCATKIDRRGPARRSRECDKNVDIVVDADGIVGSGAPNFPGATPYL